MEGWEIVTIEECCEILDNKRIPINAEERETRIGNIPYYGANGLQGFIDNYIFDEDLILIAEDGGCFDEFATRPIAYKISGKSWVNNHAHVLRAKQSHSQDFIFYSLEHKDIQPFIVGGTRAKLNQFALKSIKLSLPKLKEQEKIAEVLSTIDRAIAQTEAIIAKQQRIKTGLMQDLLTKGIDENGNIRSEATHEFKDSRLGGIPMDWDVLPANLLCLEVIDCKNRTPPAREDGHAVIRTPNVRNGQFIYDELLFTDSKSYEIWTARGKPRPRDVVITREAPFGEACLIPEDLNSSCLGQRMMMYQVDPLKITNDFLVYAIYSEKVQKRLLELAGGSTVGHIRVGDIRTLLIPHPKSVNEQIQICQMLNTISQTIDKFTCECQKLVLAKTGLMQDLLTGKVRVTNLLKEKAAGN